VFNISIIFELLVAEWGRDKEGRTWEKIVKYNVNIMTKIPECFSEWNWIQRNQLS